MYSMMTRANAVVGHIGSCQKSTKSSQHKEKSFFILFIVSVGEHGL